MPSSHYAVLRSHLTVPLSHSMVPLFFLTFYGAILILCNSNITCDCTFVTFGGSLYFFLHLMVPSLNCAGLTSFVIVLLSHFIIPLFFLTFDGTILILCRFNIICDCTFITFLRSLIFFSHLKVSSSHYAILRLLMTVLLSHSAVFFFFFSHSMVLSSHCVVLISDVTVLLSHSKVPLFFSHI